MSVQPAQCCAGAPAPACTLEVIHPHERSSTSPVHTVSARQIQQAGCHADSASSTPASYLLKRGRRILRQGQPFLPILSPTGTGSWQPGGHTLVCSGAIPVKSQWFSAGLAILPVHLSQAEESSTKGSWSQRRYLPWKCRGTRPAATSCLTAAVIPQAAVFFCSHFNLGRPKGLSNIHDRSGILKLIVP